MILELNNLTKKFGDFTAVSHINLTMNSGVYGLLGVNGAGKTTLMRMLCTLLKPTCGSIACNGKDIFHMDGGYRQLLGYLPQDFGFYPEFTVQDYLYYIATIKGLRPSVAKRKVKELIPQVGLTKAARKKMKKLSGGMKRRAGIAQAMLNEPQILILDEPTAGLDVIARDELLDMLRTYMEQDGRAILVSSHISSDLEGLCDDIYMIDNGKIVLYEETDVLLDTYGVLKVTKEQYEKLDHAHILRHKKEEFGYSCLTDQRQFYQENYPEIAIEKGTIDELIMMMIRGER